MLAATLAAAGSAIAFPGYGRAIVERAGVGSTVATIVVDFGPRTFAFQVCSPSPMTGLAALQLLDEATTFELTTTPFGQGQFVSGLAYGGYSFHGLGANGNDYWSYWTDNGAGWRFSGVGAGQRILQEGELDGWVWSAAQPNLPPNRMVPEPYAPPALALLLRRRRRP